MNALYVGIILPGWRGKWEGRLSGHGAAITRKSTRTESWEDEHQKKAASLVHASHELLWHNGKWCSIQ